MYNDANLPDDEAWVAMAQDLRETKEARNNLTKENSCVISFCFYDTLVLNINLYRQLKRKLAEVDLQREECVIAFCLFVCSLDLFPSTVGVIFYGLMVLFLSLDCNLNMYLCLGLAPVFIISAYSLCRTTDPILY